MRNIRIKDFDVILQNLGEGKGKVIIAGYGLNTSYYWGSMGSTLEDFILSIDMYYWINKLLPLNIEKPIDSRKTFAAFRKQIKECLSESVYCYGWWKEREFQSDMWERVREMQQSASCEQEFIESAFELSKRLNFYLINDKIDVPYFEEAIENACMEPWHYIVNEQSREEKALVMIYNELRKVLNKEKDEVFNQLKQAS